MSTYRRPCTFPGCTEISAPGRSQCYPHYGAARRVRKDITPAQVAELLEPTATAGVVTRTSEWQAQGKGGEIITLTSERRSYLPELEAQQALRPAQPVNVTVKVSKHAGDLRTAEGAVVVCLPDPQIGYRRLDSGGLEAFHDEAALELAVQFVSHVQPDVVVHLGDLVDFAPLSRFAQEPGFAQTTQVALDRAHHFLAECVAVAPLASHHLIEGNHDLRAQTAMAKMCPELARVKAAGSHWPAMSVPSLLGLDELGVEYTDGYPGGRLWLRDDFMVMHGKQVKSGGSTAALVLGSAPACVVMGHVHRSEFHARSVDTAHGPVTRWAASPGTLARVDGAVPSFHGSTHSSTGASVRRTDSWQQGIGVVTLIDGVTPLWEHAPIANGRLFYRGLELTA